MPARRSSYPARSVASASRTASTGCCTPAARVSTADRRLDDEQDRLQRRHQLRGVHQDRRGPDRYASVTRTPPRRALRRLRRPVVGVAGRRAGPAHPQLGQRGGLVEGDQALTVELEQAEEAGDDLERRRAVGDQRAERRRPDAAQPVAHDRGVLAHADLRRVDVVGQHDRHRLGHHRRRGDRGELRAGLTPISTSGSRPAKRGSRSTARPKRRACAASSSARYAAASL